VSKKRCKWERCGQHPRLQREVCSTPATLTRTMQQHKAIAAA
jgi:hypothetical protein